MLFNCMKTTLSFQGNPVLPLISTYATRNFLFRAKLTRLVPEIQLFEWLASIIINDLWSSAKAPRYRISFVVRELKVLLICTQFRMAQIRTRRSEVQQAGCGVIFMLASRQNDVYPIEVKNTGTIVSSGALKHLPMDGYRIVAIWVVGDRTAHDFTKETAKTCKPKHQKRRLSLRVHQAL